MAVSFKETALTHSVFTICKIGIDCILQMTVNVHLSETYCSSEDRVISSICVRCKAQSSEARHWMYDLAVGVNILQEKPKVQLSEKDCRGLDVCTIFHVWIWLQCQERIHHFLQAGNWDISVKRHEHPADNLKLELCLSEIDGSLRFGVTACKHW